MAMLMIKCPRTGQVISTGIETDPYSTEPIPRVLVHTPCPYCGTDHAWWPNQAWLVDDTQGPAKESTGQA